MHEGHGRGRFNIPVVDFARVFSPGAEESELAKVAGRGSIEFAAGDSRGGTFRLAEGERALFDLKREGLVMRVPPRMSGWYSVTDGGFRIDFNPGEELEGCKRILLLVCNRIASIEVSGGRVDVRSAGGKLFDLCVEF